MRRPTAALGLLLALVGLLAAFAPIPAVAQESARGGLALEDITVQDGRIRFLVTGLDRSSGPAALTDPVRLRVDGYAVAARAAAPERRTEPGPRTTMLVVDTSGSMDGA